MSKVSGKVAVVTGAGSGIGRALAVELANRGARLALSDVNEASLGETVDAVKQQSAEVHAARLDVADREAVSRYADDVATHFGVVHQIYNNAGIADSFSVTDGEYARYERLLGINLWGVIYGTKEFLPHLIASGDGHVVNLSSLNGYLAQPEMSAYCTAKYGVRGFTEALRCDMLAEGHPVQVSVVHPGGVATNIANAALASGEERGETPTEKDLARARTYNEKLLRMPATRAAAIIVDGVEAGRSRILVGRDAIALDALVRLAPGWAPGLAMWGLRRLAAGKR
ncbi:SDR family NAD(P)-dependent oxidoreductase [Mycobacterium sp. MYCO198283]|uniref:SDR family NAD(P)-dependent oxidoreductase n=1 Tax=Mycobacterium sp. MYCO198283 TaxID=2883505 RepID=UPI001E2A3CD6|nr:SDR family NAD(P)-dependent oxidoreductase [Mycobacterium sp. MYCO198283]MCG5433061.1 SDR family NAD(P)-dependent oxidoreductase [Mycobacterium sp. MYCO198283]